VFYDHLISLEEGGNSDSAGKTKSVRKKSSSRNGMQKIENDNSS